jgi:myosin-5
MVMERFRFLQYKLGPSCVLDSGDIKIDVDTLLSHLLAGVTANSHKEGKVKAYACGKTRVYFRAGALETIETTRQAYYAASAIVLQAWFRSLSSRHHFMHQRQSVIRLQSNIRCYLARKFLSRQVYCALIVQCFIRKCLAKKKLLYLRRERASTAIQTRWRGGKPRQQFKAIREAAISIQCLNRMIVGKKIVAMKKKERSKHVAMESRMSVVQQAFSCVGSVQGSVFSVDEGLLDEVETMFEFLRKEIVVLRKKNMKLKKDLSAAESDKREIFKHSQNLDHSFAVAKIRNEQMSKTNNTLFEDNSKRRKEMIKLKNELKTQQQAHEAQLQEMRSEFETALRRRDLEVTSIAQHLQSSESAHKRELQQVRDEAERKQDEHFSQISRLREEVINTQNSHQDYLSKLMDVLETTQESRRAVSAISDDTHLLRRKDDEILMLKEQVAKLRHKSEASTNDVVDTSRSRSQNDDIKSMKKVIKKNREGRKSRVQYLGDLANQLEASLALGDLSQVNQLLMSMKETVQKGEKESSKIDRAMVNMLDNAFS